jgi:hypothetical protein
MYVGVGTLTMHIPKHNHAYNYTDSVIDCLIDMYMYVGVGTLTMHIIYPNTIMLV